MFVLAGLLAAVLSWLFNNYILNKISFFKVMTYIAPVIEETTKTLLAVIFQTSIFFTHGVFGAIEAVKDIFSASEKGVYAAVASVFGHMLFGLLTVVVLELTGLLILSLFIGYMIHMLWNYMIIKGVSQNRR